MQVEVIFNKNTVQLLFDLPLKKGETEKLKAIGFKRYVGRVEKWYAPSHPAFVLYAKELKEKGGFFSAMLQASFLVSESNIERNKFTLVKVFYKGEKGEEDKEYLVFDSYKSVAFSIAEAFGKDFFKEKFIKAEALGKKSKERAFNLLKKGAVLPPKEEKSQPYKAIFNKLLKLVPGFKDHLEKGYRYGKSEVGDKRLELFHCLIGGEKAQKDHEIELLVCSISEDTPEKGLWMQVLVDFENKRAEALSFRDALGKEMVYQRGAAERKVDELQQKEQNKFLSHWLSDLLSEKHQIVWGMAPKKHCFFKDDIVRWKPSHLSTYDDYIVLGEGKNPGEVQVIRTIDLCSAEFWKREGTAVAEEELELIITQRELKEKYGYDFKTLDDLAEKVDNKEVLLKDSHDEERGLCFVKTRLYREGAESQRRALMIIEKAEKYLESRPLKKLTNESGVYTEESAGDHYEEIVIPFRKKSKYSGKIYLVKDENGHYRYGISFSKDFGDYNGYGRGASKKSKAYSSRTVAQKEALSEHLKMLMEHVKRPDSILNNEKRKHQLLNNAISDLKEYALKEGIELNVEQETKTEFPLYLDQVIAYMHEKYASGERLSKGKIEALQNRFSVPNKGVLWEAVELSWLLWYKQLYRQQSPFESRLSEMISFWNHHQPTYLYSDSSKELYKQYSTPCPIGAMLAQYTGMEKAKRVFEPSAGNGLLLVGAKEKHTHVNEIDSTRLLSLKFQGFSKVTKLNASAPFGKEMEKKYDVMVTNPPFSKWEEIKRQKEQIVQEYFNSHLGLSRFLRLEHLMAGLALRTLKDSGRAGIIIMGHVYFDKDGYIAKYRPFFNWLYRHYKVDDVINMNSFKLYNKQGAIERTMLILIRHRVVMVSGEMNDHSTTNHPNHHRRVAPRKEEALELEEVVNSFEELWERISRHIDSELDVLIQQLKMILKK